MRTDIENLADGDKVTLHPNETNPLHKSPVEAVYFSGYFHCSGHDPAEGPDYYWGDVLKYNHGFTVP